MNDKIILDEVYSFLREKERTYEKKGARGRGNM